MRAAFPLLLCTAFSLALFACSSEPAIPPHGTYATLLQAVQANDLYGALDRLKAGADLYATDELGYPPLLIAVQNDQPHLVDALVRHGAPLAAVDPLGNSALHIAAAANRVYIIGDLCAKGLSTELRNQENYTPLHVAAREGQPEAAQKLIECGASTIALVTHNARTMPIFLAAERKHWDTVAAIRPHTFAYNVFDAISFGDIDTVKHLVETVPGMLLSADSTKGMGRSLLQLALMYGQVEIARYLYEQEAPFQPYTDEGIPVIFEVAEGGYKEALQLMADHGADINANTPKANRDNVLHHLARTGGGDLTEFCIGLGAKVDHANQDGDTPLHVAAKLNRAAIVQVLLRHGASPTAKNKANETPVDLAPDNSESKRALEASAAAPPPTP